MTTRYIGSGPYCYANCLAMALGDGIDPGLMEVLTGSPFGMQLLGGHRPLFDPLGWDPETGIDAALSLLGWTCQRSHGTHPAMALQALRAALAGGPALVGPVEMGLLQHQPDAAGAIGADHYVLVTGLDGDRVCFHDPDGYPHATLAADSFAAAWRGESIEYARAEYTMRSGFHRIRLVAAEDALRACVPAAIGWLHGRSALAPPGSLGGGEAALALAELVEMGLTDAQRDELVCFAVRLGARRLSDAQYWLARVGLTHAAEIAGEQSRLVGSLQYPLVTNDKAAAARILRVLAPTYRQLAEALSA